MRHGASVPRHRRFQTCSRRAAWRSTARIVYGWLATARMFYVIAPDGSITAPTMPPTLGAGVIAFDAKDRLYVLDMFSLTRISPDGSALPIIASLSFTGAPPPGLSYLTGLGVDPAKNVYFGSDSTSLFIGSMMMAATVLSTRTLPALGVAIDAAGTAWGGILPSRMLPDHLRWAGWIPAILATGDLRNRRAFNSPSPSSTFAPNGDMYFVDGDRIRRFTGIQPQTPPVISPGGIVNSASYNGGANLTGRIGLHLRIELRPFGAG